MSGVGVLVVDLEAAAVDGGEQGVAEGALAAGREDELLDDVLAEGVLEEGGDAGADAGGVDDDAAAVPDVAQDVDEGLVEVAVAAAGPFVVLDDVGDGLLDVVGDGVVGELGDGDDDGVAPGFGGGDGLRRRLCSASPARSMPAT